MAISKIAPDAAAIDLVGRYVFKLESYTFAALGSPALVLAGRGRVLEIRGIHRTWHEGIQRWLPTPPETIPEAWIDNQERVRKATVREMYASCDTFDELVRVVEHGHRMEMAWSRMVADSKRSLEALLSAAPAPEDEAAPKL